MESLKRIALAVILAASAGSANAALPDLTLGHSIGSQGVRIIEPGGVFVIRIGYSNKATVPATGVTLTVNSEGATSFTVLPPQCVASETRVTCTIGTVDGTDPIHNAPSHILFIHAKASEESKPFATTAEIRSNEDDANPDDNRTAGTTFVYHMFPVTHTGDRGSGSLRDAIEQVNALCNSEEPCKIAFRIEEPSSVHRIEPETPLPAVTARSTTIDGTTQTRYVADSNLSGPEIELNGARLERSYLGNGLVLGCGASVNDLVINGFPSNGVLLRSDMPCETQPSVRFCYIGTDAAGTAAVPNVRGVYVDGAAASVSSNIISGNERSGVFIARGAGTIVSGNTIGLDRGQNAAIPNGASGVAIIGDAEGAVIDGNRIAFNAHHGISAARLVMEVGLRRNLIHSNNGLGIDNGIDGIAGETRMPAPEVLEAREDPLDSPGSRYYSYGGTAMPSVIPSTMVIIDIYASRNPDPSGYGEGEFHIGSTTTDARGRWGFSTHGHPPPGADWITATATELDLVRNRQTTSEFSRAVKRIPLSAGTN